LDKLDDTYQRGPYLISVLKQPLSDVATPVQVHLLQDFTGKVPELVSNAVDLLTYRDLIRNRQAAVLKIREYIAIAQD
jgi:hypothetical protein